MERDIWKRLVLAINRLEPTRLRNAVYTDREILAVFFWAALHDRPISWACRRANWPMQAWRRKLPDQSTMSRRLRRPDILELLRRVLSLVQEDGVDATMLAIIDGKALELSEHTRDPDARTGRGVCGYAKGYKLHVLIDDGWRVLAWRVRPLNEAECLVAQDLLRDAARWSSLGLAPHTIMLADASYDSNRLHLRAATLGVQMIAPRRKPHLGLAGNRTHHPSRLLSVRITEGDGAAARMMWIHRERDGIERYFGTLASSGGGLDHLPTWVRRLHRCERWVGAKLIINAARIRHRRSIAA